MLAHVKGSRAQVLDDLRRCVAKGWNYRWHGQRGLRGLKPGVDHELVERAMELVFPLTIAQVCHALPDEYEALAWRVIGRTATPDATFLDALGELRRGCAWLCEVQRIDDTKRNRGRVATLKQDAVLLEAARATVARHGIDAQQLVAVLAHDGSEDSVDVLLDTVQQALAKRDERLDGLEKWLVPFARGTGMAAVVAALRSAMAERGAASPLLALLSRFGAKGTQLSLSVHVRSREVYRGLARRASFSVALDSHHLPGARASVSRDRLSSGVTSWADGHVKQDELGLGGPSSADDLPRWLAVAAKKLGVTWDRSTLQVEGSLRGKARAAAVEWLLGG